MTCQWFLRLFDTECVVTQLYHKQTTGESDKILIKKKNPVGKKRILRDISLLFFRVNVNVLKQTSLQALWNMLQPLKHWESVVLSSINIKKWFLKFIREITVTVSENFIQWDIIQTCWKWEQVNIYTRKLTLNSHCVKSVQIRSYFRSVFSCFRTEYGDLLFTQCPN